MAWIDSHAHLVSDGVYEHCETYLKQCQEHNVNQILVICANEKELKRALALPFDIAIGIHPSDINSGSENELKRMLDYYPHPQIVAIGEIGLDYYWDDSQKERQKELFREQLTIANQLDLPIVVHVRSSMADILAILKDTEVKRHGVIHCFSGTASEAIELTDMGYYLGFGGILTFKNAESVREAFTITPKDRVLSETDTPYLSPVPMRGKPNQPAHVRYVGEKMAELWGLDALITQQILQENYDILFKKD